MVGQIDQPDLRRSQTWGPHCFPAVAFPEAKPGGFWISEISIILPSYHKSLSQKYWGFFHNHTISRRYASTSNTIIWINMGISQNLSLLVTMLRWITITTRPNFNITYLKNHSNNDNNKDWLVVSIPLNNISQLGWLFPIYGKIKVIFQSPPTRRKS